MYDDVPFDPASNTMQLADVGLNSLYILDCESMAAIAEILDRADEAEEFAARAGEFRRRAAELWDDERGIFANRFTASAESGVAASASPASGNFSPRISPTSFYALLGGLATPEQARRMVDEHLLNPEEFGGTWMIPATPRNDPAYHDQDYWRGRIWAPMNFLVYLGLRRYGLSAAAAELADRSKSLLLKEWREHGHIHENYNADTGEGCDTKRSDRYYHWGGLLGVIYLLERGRIPSPQFADAPPPTEGGAPAGRRSAGEDHG
jgi:neutral trehalase